MLDVEAIRRRALLEVPVGGRVFLGAGLPSALDLTSRQAVDGPLIDADVAFFDASTPPPTHDLSRRRTVVMTDVAVVTSDLKCDRWIGPLGVIDFADGVPCVVEVPAGVSAQDVQHASRERLFAASTLAPVRQV